VSQLDVVSLTRQFGGLTAVKDLSFSVSPGAIAGLVGPNGAGKTTVINMVSGIDKPTSGTISIAGQDTSTIKGHEFVRLGIARTYQNMKMFHGLSVIDHVIVGLDSRRKTTFFHALVPNPIERKERAAMRDKAMEFLKVMSIDHLAESEATTLPYGLQRRLEIARALATEPKLLLLDEPTAGMNQQESSEVAEVLRGLNQKGLTLLVVEHNIKFVRDLCQEVTVINFGEKLLSGTPQEVFNSQLVREAYLGKQRDERLATFQSLRAGTHRNINMGEFAS